MFRGRERGSGVVLVLWLRKGLADWISEAARVRKPPSVETIPAVLELTFQVREIGGNWAGPLKRVQPIRCVLKLIVASS